MENNELKKIWNTLAENKLIDSELAKENILKIITKKGNGIISKMLRKSKIDYYVHLAGLIFIPIATLIVHLNIRIPFSTMRAYFGLAFVELFFLYMIINALRNINFLNFSYNNSSIKVKTRFESYWKKEYWVSLTFGYAFLAFTFVHFFIIVGGFHNLSFANSGFQTFASYFIFVILVFMVVWPFILKIQYRMRFSGILDDVNETLIELNSEY
jgi:hypothetical protein